MKVQSIGKLFLTRILSFGKPQKKILFDSFGGAQYSADPRAISEKMHSLYPDYELVWFLKSNVYDKYGIIPSYVKVVTSRFEFVKQLASSCAYVTTEPITESFYKRKGQMVIQTWHGDRGIKKVLYDVYEEDGRDKKRQIKIYDNKYTDLCVAGSEYGEKTYRTAFRYLGTILKEGMPRNDKLVNYDSNEALHIKHLLSISEYHKILLYAPTFRGHTEMEQKSEIDIERTLHSLEAKGEKWICLLRAHTHSKKINHLGGMCKIIDVSDYPDMADLLLITDLLITDYSSCAGDYILRKKPIILAINDEEDYIKNSRSLCVELDKTGFILSHSQEELENIIKYTTIQDFINACNKVLPFYGTVENGHAASTICEMINKHYTNIQQ